MKQPNRARDCAGCDQKTIKRYFKHLSSDQDSKFNSFVLINFAKQHLDNLGVENYHFCWDAKPDIPRWNRTNIVFRDFDYTLGTAEDHEHPDKAAHEKMACDMLADISQKRNSP
jgi:hypothetical protein